MRKPSTELSDHQVTPNPKLEKRTRRQFSPEFKLRILAEADVTLGCDKARRKDAIDCHQSGLESTGTR